jgi:hypothetical protein
MFVDDLDAFFDGMDAKTVTVGSDSFLAYFDNGYFDANSGGTVSISSSSPAMTAKSADVTRLSLQRGTVLTLDAENYSIHDLQPDGSGVTQILLHESRA